MPPSRLGAVVVVVEVGDEVPEPVEVEPLAVIVPVPELMA